MFPAWLQLYEWVNRVMGGLLSKEEVRALSLREAIARYQQKDPNEAARMLKVFQVLVQKWKAYTRSALVKQTPRGKAIPPA